MHKSNAGDFQELRCLRHQHSWYLNEQVWVYAERMQPLHYLVGIPTLSHVGTYFETQ